MDAPGHGASSRGCGGACFASRSCLALAAVGLTLAMRWVNPPITWLMLSEWMRLGAIERDWVPLSAMSATCR